jgi:hypothetical protein
MPAFRLRPYVSCPAASNGGRVGATDAHPARNRWMILGGAIGGAIAGYFAHDTIAPGPAAGAFGTVFGTIAGVLLATGAISAVNVLQETVA